MLHLRTFGAIDLRDSDGRQVISVLDQPKRLAVILYLALATPRGSHRRDTLLALFWPEQNTDSARNALNQTIHFLRRELGPDAVATGGRDELGLDWANFDCDARAFEEAIARDKLDEAAKIYEGELLPGFHLADCSDFQQWLDAERARMRQQFADVLERLAVQRQQAGDDVGAIAQWKRLAALDPLSSRVAARLIRSLADAGDRPAALQQARIHETLVRQELDADPDAEISALVADLKKPEAARSTRAPRSDATPGADIPAHLAASGGDLPGLLPPPGTAPRSIRVATLAGVIALAAAVALLGSMRRDPGASNPIRRIAVLPLANLSGDSTQNVLADIISDELITELARYPNLVVISRQSALGYRNTRKSAKQIAGELEVDGLVEGGVVREGGRVRVDARLVRASTEANVWARRYERDTSDFIGLYDDVADAIARELHVALAPTQAASPSHKTDEISYALYLRAQSLMTSRSPAAINAAITLFHQAVGRDSSFGLGYAGLAEAFNIANQDNYLPRRLANDSATFFATRALAVDSLLAEGHIAFGATLAEHAQFALAEQEYLRAIALEPGNALAHHWYASLLGTLRRGTEAHREIIRARQLHPLSTSIANTMGVIRIMIGLKGAYPPKGFVRVIDPTNPWSVYNVASGLAAQHKCPEAWATMQKARDLAPDNMRLEINAVALAARCGDTARALAHLAALERRPDARVNGLGIALAFATLHQLDSAFVWLAGIDWNADMRWGFQTQPGFAEVRKDPRAIPVLRRMGISTQ